MTEIRTRHDGLSVDQAAEQMGVSPQTVRSWIGRGLLPATQVGPTSRSPHRIRPEDLEKMRGPRQRGAVAPADRLDLLADAIEGAIGDGDETVQSWCEQLRTIAREVRTP